MGLALFVGLGRVFQSTVVRIFLAWTVWLVLSVPFSVWPGGAFTTIKDEWLKSLMAGVIVVALVQVTRNTSTMLKTMACAFSVAGLLSFPYGEVDLGRLQLNAGVYENPNDYATAMLYGCICWWYVLHSPKHSKLLKLIGLASLFFQVYMILKTGSRAALVAAVITFIPIVFRYSIFARLMILAMLPIVGVGFLAMTSPEQRNRYLTIFSPTVEGSNEEEDALIGRAAGSRQHRIDLAKDAAILTVQNPLFGVGAGMYSVAQDVKSRDAGRPKGSWLGTHNTYLQVASESGLPGLVLFIGLLIYCWSRTSLAYRYFKDSRDENAKDICLMAYTLRLLLLSSFVFFCFEHIAYAPFLPVLTGLISGFWASLNLRASRVPFSPELRPT